MQNYTDCGVNFGMCSKFTFLLSIFVSKDIVWSFLIVSLLIHNQYYTFAKLGILNKYNEPVIKFH